MKSKIFTLLVMALGLLVSTNAFAQPSTPSSTSAVTAKDGSTVTYTVTGTGTFHWALSGGSNTNTVSSSTTNSVSVTWDNATPGSTYNLDVYLVDGNNCYSEVIRFAVTIESVVLSITDATTETCSWLGSDNSTGNSSSVSANDIIEFTLTLDAAGAQDPVTVNYSVSDGTTTDSRSEDVTFSGLSGTLNVAIDNFFVNTDGSNKTFTITLTSATDADSNALDIHATNKTATISVHSKPTITF